MFARGDEMINSPQKINFYFWNNKDMATHKSQNFSKP